MVALGRGGDSYERGTPVPCQGSCRTTSPTDAPRAACVRVRVRVRVRVGVGVGVRVGVGVGVSVQVRVRVKCRLFPRRARIYGV